MPEFNAVTGGRGEKGGNGDATVALPPLGERAPLPFLPVFAFWRGDRGVFPADSADPVDCVGHAISADLADFGRFAAAKLLARQASPLRFAKRICGVAVSADLRRVGWLSCDVGADGGCAMAVAVSADFRTFALIIVAILAGFRLLRWGGLLPFLPISPKCRFSEERRRCRFCRISHFGRT
jgi:hypothetical protein